MICQRKELDTKHFLSLSLQKFCIIDRNFFLTLKIEIKNKYEPIPLILLRDGGEMPVDLILGQDGEGPLVGSHHAHLDLGGLEVGAQDGGQAVDGQLHGAVQPKVRLLLQLLLKKGVGLGLFGADRASLERREVQNE